MEKLSARRLIATSSNTLYFLAPLFPANFGEIGDSRELAQQFREQRQAVAANRFVFRHHHYAVEKLVDNFSQTGDGFQRFLILPRSLVGLHLCRGSANCGINVAFGAAPASFLIAVPPI